MTTRRATWLSPALLPALAFAMLTLSISAPAAAATTVHTSASRQQLGDVQQALNALAKTTGVVGTIAQAYVDGKRVDQGSAGSRLLGGRGGRIPVNSRYRIGSQTKHMVASVLLQLVEEGRIGLDDKLSKVLPVVAELDLVERANEITVRQLIRHTSGIPDYLRTGIDALDPTTYRPIDLVEMSRGLPRTGYPGEKFSYSNTNYVLLGMIIEKVTGNTLAAELDQRIFAPLGMRRSYLPTKPHEGIKGPHGHGYQPDAEGVLRDVDRLNVGYGGAAGGVISTARDVSAFHRAFNRGRLLPPELQRVITDPPKGAPSSPPGDPLCGGEPILRMAVGSAPGYMALTLTSPDNRTQFVLSATLALERSYEIQPAVNEAAEAVLCPGKQAASAVP